MKPSDVAFDQLERIEVNGIVRFLKEAGVFPAEVAKAGLDLFERRDDGWRIVERRNIGAWSQNTIETPTPPAPFSVDSPALR